MDNWKDDIFFENEEMPEVDIKMFDEVLASELSKEERLFFEQTRAKETGEFAPSADLLLSEDDNEERLFLVRYYFTEWKLGQADGRKLSTIYCDNLSEMLSANLFPFINRHLSLLEWLEERNFMGVKYNGNFAIGE